ncbi:iron-containing alcohol dehydrogenase [Vagococcus hydrophili]|uniref:Iron-containing alcohol dehydrogenase n=1 Tax=Vagococcus hydrophili TaxID=2714947 RepID=A0A6G8ARI4_9ENTE|nr:iron-containing alcohol dehydrogenase [Vagococcus hydrophili]QIL47674.1 iron-containing alcohol dehydrogenase [Vagococcus hydrophili]
MDYKLEQSVKVLVADHLAETTLDVLNNLGYSHPMIVIDSFLLQSTPINDLLTAFKENKKQFTLYDKVIPNPPIELINKGAQIFTENHCDSIIAIGGGSVIDAARGINIVRHLGGSIADYAYDKEITAFCSGLIAIPTTSGTGSELSNALIVTDTEKNEKIAVLSNEAVSEVAILCPDLLVSLPEQLTISTGLDAFSHAAEAYTSTLSTPVVDAICEKIMFLIYKYLPLATQNGQNKEARERMMVAAALGGWVLNNGGTHIGHSQAHIIGAKLNIPHGQACAYALPGTLKATASVKPKKIKEIGYILEASFPENATNEQIGEITAARYRDFRDSILGLTPFETLNISREDITALSKEVQTERFSGNTPFELTDEIVLQLMKEFG